MPQFLAQDRAFSDSPLFSLGRDCQEEEWVFLVCQPITLVPLFKRHILMTFPVHHGFFQSPGCSWFYKLCASGAIGWVYWLDFLFSVLFPSCCSRLIQRNFQGAPQGRQLLSVASKWSLGWGKVSETQRKICTSTGQVFHNVLFSEKFCGFWR